LKREFGTVRDTIGSAREERALAVQRDTIAAV